MATKLTGDALVKSNQEAAAKLGVTIPGVGGGDAPNIVLSSTKVSADGTKGPTKVQNYKGSTPVGPATITSANTAPSPTVQLPSPAPTSSTGTNAMTLLAGLGASATAPGSTPGSTTTPPATQTPTTTPESTLQAYLKSLTPPPDTASLYKKAEKDAGIQEKQNLVNTYTNQINAITAKATADKLSVTGQGRGIPEAIIGGQQAQIDKEAAIQALPIAAQLSAAQGDLATAQTHLSTLFTLYSQDAKNQAEYKNKLVTAVYDFADKQQQKQLDDLKTKNSQDFQMKTNTLNYAQSLATAAINNGQPSVASALMRLDPNSPDYASNVAAMAKNIVVPQKSTGGSGEVTAVQLSMYINKQIASSDFQKLSPTDQKLYIRSQGGDPYDYGY